MGVVIEPAGDAVCDETRMKHGLDWVTERKHA